MNIQAYRVNIIVLFKGYEPFWFQPHIGPGFETSRYVHRKHEL